MTAIEAMLHCQAGEFRLDVEFEAGPGITVLFGPSGSGKSLTLRAVAGILTPRDGRVVVDGRVVFDSRAGISVPAHARGVGYAGQRPALFPHLSVGGNVAFGIRAGSKQARARTAAEWLARLELPGFEGRSPGSLSGGQAQRVALARALAPGHRVLLLDEPFSALDESLRQGLRRLLTDLVQEGGLAIIFVTHDLREAHLLANRLVVIDRGQVLQAGLRDEVFRAPRHRRVAELLGGTNILPGRVVRRDAAAVTVAIAGWNAVAASWHGDPQPGDPVDVLIRPERVVIRRGEPAALNALPARIRREFDYGSGHSLEFTPLGPGPSLVVDLPSRPYDVLGIASRKDWMLELPPGDLHVMPAVPSRRETTQESRSLPGPTSRGS